MHVQQKYGEPEMNVDENINFAAERAPANLYRTQKPAQLQYSMKHKNNKLT
jgi:hypothetical protein